MVFNGDKIGNTKSYYIEVRLYRQNLISTRICYLLVRGETLVLTAIPVSTRREKVISKKVSSRPDTHALQIFANGVSVGLVFPWQEWKTARYCKIVSQH